MSEFLGEMGTKRRIGKLENRDRKFHWMLDFGGNLFPTKLSARIFSCKMATLGLVPWKFHWIPGLGGIFSCKMATLGLCPLEIPLDPRFRRDFLLENGHLGGTFSREKRRIPGPGQDFRSAGGGGGAPGDEATPGAAGEREARREFCEAFSARAFRGLGLRLGLVGGVRGVFCLFLGRGRPINKKT